MEEANPTSSSGVALSNPHPSPCCSEWKKKLVKSEEKRNALRQAVKLYESQMDKIQAENLKLKQEFEQVKLQVKFEKEAKDKEATLRSELEKEINNLKQELSSIQKNDCVRNTDQDQKQQKQLEAGVLEYETQIKRLKQLLDKEKKKLEFEKKKSETEKNRAMEAQKVLEIEKSKVEEEKRLSELNRRKVLEYQNVFENFKQEVSEEREKLVAERNKAINASKKAEAERQKAIKDIKRAEIERAKTEEAMRSLEVERKNANDEKARADHLSEQLKLESQKREELQAGMDRRISLINVKKDPVCLQDKPYSGYENVKLLKEKLKLVKTQGKHARKMAKLQEMENDLLRREICLLKQEFVNFSWHLNLLGSHLSQSVKGIADFSKMDKPSMPRDFKLNGESANTLHSHRSRGKNEPSLHKISSRRNKTRECAGTLLSEVGGSLSSPISGINSDLESPIRDSTGKKSQSSVECSTTASFSDRTFVGSQEKGPPAATTSTKTTGMKMVSNGDISGETTKLGKGKSIGNISESNHLDHACRKWTPWSNLKFDEEHEELESRQRPKRRKIDDASDPVGWTFSEKLRLPVLVPQSKDLSKPPDNELTISDIPFVIEKNKKTCHDDKRKEFKMEEINSTFLCPKDYHGSVLEYGNRTGFLQEHMQSTFQFPSKRDIILDPFYCESDEVDISYLKEMLNGNSMRFLELDNAADEERYRAAVARPLSPTLPILTSCNLTANYSHSNEEIVAGYSNDDNEKSLQPDIADSEPGVNVVKSRASAPLEIVTEGSRSNKAAVVIDQSLSCKIVQSASVSEIREMTASDPKSISNGQSTNNGSWLKITSLFCVAYFKSEEEENILRLFRALEAVIFKSSMVSRTDNVLTELFSCFAFLEDLQSMEKASVIFSLMLYHTTSLISADSESFFTLHKCSGAFEAELSAGSERFLEICKTDCLIEVIEHFLIHQKVYIYTNQADLLDKGESSATGECVNKRDVHISSKIASVNQLVAGGMILASLCKVFNNVDFLWKVSYRILRTFRCNSSSILVMLHTFASVCGEKFFSSAENQFSAIVIKSVVLHLELSQGSSHLNLSERDFSFPCKKCPFVQGAVCLDKLVPFLMSKLQHLSGASKVPSNKEVDVVDILENTYHNSVLYPDGDCDGSCCIIKYVEVTCECNGVSSEMLCSFVDVLSLVELAAHFMDWCWTFENIVPKLLEMVQLCPAEGYASALLVLTGNLGRVGVDADGYDDIRVAELRSGICKFLDLDTTRNGSLLVQVAAVCVITHLLPLSFKEIVGGGERYKTSFASSCSHAESVKSWFSQLTEKQKNMSLHLFEHGDVTT